MKRLIPVLLLVLSALLIVGCSQKKETTHAIPVDNPSEESQNEPVPTATKPIPPPKPDKDGVVTLPSGLKYKDKKVGKGPEVIDNARATVHYKGWLDNGKVFDTSKQQGRSPFSFTVGAGEVIRGWDLGVKGMKVGGIRELTIPPDLGYGSDDQSAIPANSTLHFEVELLDMVR
jgi:FKBP-type peptidyl-prolyl cis-trans isomerase